MKKSSGWVAPVALVAALAVPAPAVLGQTSYSLRLDALSPRFGGVVEDLVTDSFLNPARVSSYSGTQVFVAKTPTSYQTLAYPGIESSYDRNVLLPPENWLGTTSYGPVPYQVNLFTGLGRVHGAFTVAGYVSTSESLVEGSDISTLAGTVNFNEMARGTRHEISSLRVEGAISTGDSAGDESFGLRVQLASYTLKDDYARSSTEWYFLPSGDASVDAEYRSDSEQLEHLDALVTGGWFRPGSMLRELMVAAGYTRRQFDTRALATDSEDTDYDGNGVGVNGSLYQFYQRVDLDGERTYDGPVLRGRVHVDLTDDVVFVTGGSWEYTTGSGPAVYHYNSTLNDLGGSSTATIHTPYDYDGSDTRYDVYGTIAYHTRLTPALLVAMGANLQFSRQNFSEDGTGVMDVELTGQAPASAEVDYVQKAWRVADSAHLRLPVALEWLVVNPLALRVGLELYGVRDERTEAFRRTPDTSSLPPDYQRSDGDRITDSSHTTGMRISSGLGVSLARRLFVDLSSGADSRVDLATFYDVSLRFIF